MRTFSGVEELEAAVGQHLGYSEWLEIDQVRIDTFADATDDHQWIHVDADRAAEGPFGRTIAHGYLTVSLLPALVSTVVSYDGWPVKVNYGSDKVRFPQPVLVGSRVRVGVELLRVISTAAGVQVAMRSTMEVEGPDGVMFPKPALVAETLTLLVG